MDLGPIAGGITAEQFAANLSALSCPDAHAAAIPVDDLAGEVVAWLCPHCDMQLPADWRPAPPSYSRLFLDPALISDNRRTRHRNRRRKS